MSHNYSQVTSRTFTSWEGDCRRSSEETPA